ncbi:MAG: 50S ribosomal protein L11 methyltransferase [Frankiaceae bacterium]
MTAAIQAQADELNRLARSVSQALAELADPAVTAEIINDVATRTIPRWHFGMLNDVTRNDALAKAVELTVTEADHVLDIGTGVGLLAMMAARAGAAKVTACEENPLLAELARQVVAAQGWSDVITIVPKRSTDLEIGRDIDAPADVIVSEIVDCGIVGEGLLPTMRHARERLLRPGGTVLPRALRLHGFLVESESLAELNRARLAGGFDISLVNVVATHGHFPVRLHDWQHETLSETVELLSFDVQADDLVAGRRVVAIPVRATGTGHGLAAWFEMDLCEGIQLTNHPSRRDSHWMQALMLFGRPVPVRAGSCLYVDLAWTDYRLMCDDPSPPDLRGLLHD